jgi:serine/threonine protein kinase
MVISSPTLLADYEIEGEIGCGNLTEVYRARRKSDGQPVSVKVVMPEFTSDRIFVRRFVEAGSRAIRLDHPNIARVYEVAERDGTVYVVREFIEAECLADMLHQQGSLPPAQAVPVIRQLASALDYAHSRRAMHGDINDRCIYVDHEGRVKLADFGLTQSVTGLDLTLNQPRRVKMVQGMGAPEYLAPERVQGQGPSRPADIYALGVVAYQLLTGHPPFSGELEAVLEDQVYQLPPPIQTENPKLSPTLNAAVTRALSKRPELRYNTATEFARAFAAAAEGIAPGRDTLATARPRITQPRGRPTTLLLAVILLAIVVAALALLWNVTGIGLFLAGQLESLVPSPIPALTGQPQLSPTPQTAMPSPTVQVVVLSPTSPAAKVSPAPMPTHTSTLTSTATAIPTGTATPTSIYTPFPATVTQASPFRDLVLAAGMDGNNMPISPGNTFPVSSRPIYLFFNYSNIQPGTSWGHVWLRGNEVLNRTVDKWPVNWGVVGRSWIYYTPEGSYLTGSYEVQLLVNDQVVASAAFSVQ